MQNIWLKEHCKLSFVVTSYMDKLKDFKKGQQQFLQFFKTQHISTYCYELCDN